MIFCYLLVGAILAFGVCAALVVSAFLVPDRVLRAVPWGNLDEADVFIGFGFGLGCNTAGASNIAIAQWILANNPQRKPTIVQEGVRLALEQLLGGNPGDWVIPLPHHPCVYVDTFGAALQSWAIMNLQGWSRPVLVSHDLQLQRMVWCFEKVQPLAAGIIVPDLPTSPFDPDSVQHRGTRWRWCWVLREMWVARPLMGRELWRCAALVLPLLVSSGFLLWFFCVR